MPVPPSIDPDRATIAGAYNSLLGGKDAYGADRRVIAEIERLQPDARDMAIASRAFLFRAIRYLADRMRIEQFIDCGCGLPTDDKTHEIARKYHLDARTVYVDNDPVVLTKARALLVDDHSFVVDADVFDPGSVLANKTVTLNVDFSEPVGLIMNTTLAFCEKEPQAVMAQYIDALAPGSHVVFSHFLDPETPDLTPVAKSIEKVLRRTFDDTGRFRSRAELLDLLPGLTLLPPGLVTPADWWPEGPRMTPVSDPEKCVAVAVAVKP